MKMTPIKSDETTEFKSKLQQIPIAVIGMACVFPQARDLREYWDNIIKGVDAIVDIPPSRWNINDYYDSDPKVPDKTYCKRGGFLPDVDFDPMEFGMPPNILEVTDVSQLLALVVAKEVLEDAGYGASNKCDRDKIGIVLGVGGGQKLISPLNARLQYPVWKNVLIKEGVPEEDAERICETIKKAYIPWEENSFPGMLGNVISGRITNRLDLGGINCVLDAACASSMAALKMAISELLEYRSDIMITGGVDTDNSIHMYMCFSKTPAFTADDKCRPFDVESSGMIIGEGIGMVALKRLDEAERDNDRIYAVIRGIGASSDGRFKSIYNPRPAGQAKALRWAYADAGFPPSSVGLLEAHGTGTMAGDPAEIVALKEVFGENNVQTQHVALGSVKSQIGHTKAAAGIASLIKAALALEQKVLPPTINIDTPNPKFDLENSPFYLNTETRPWVNSSNGYPRRAAVSSFGFGGTNFHVVLEEYKKKSPYHYRLHTVTQGLVLSAPTSKELIAECNDVLQKLESEEGEKHYQELSQACKAAEISAKNARLGFVSASLTEACALLKLAVDTLQAKGEEESWDLPKGVYYRREGLDLSGKVVALFSGQGAQYLGMGNELACDYPPLIDAYRNMDQLFIKDGWEPLSQTVFPRPVFDPDQEAANTAQLQRTEYAQPAIGVMSAGLYNILHEAGFQPDFVAGHSFGELTALWAAQVLSDADYFALARARGKAMAAPQDPDFDAGTMLAVIGDFEKIKADVRDLPTVTLANLNSKREVVVAGSTKDMAAAQKSLEENGYRVIPLPVSAAFHTTLVGHAQKPFAKALRAATFKSPKCPVYSNTTGKPYPSDPEAIQKILGQHILNPVLFKEEIENIYNGGGQIFVEFGPKGILTKLVGNILEGKPHIAIALNATPKKGSEYQLRQAVIQLRVAGLPLQDIDPYQRDFSIPSKKKSVTTVKLNGANFVSEKTRKAYLDALNDGKQIKQAAASVQGPSAPPPGKEMTPSGVGPAAETQTTAPSSPLTQAAGVDHQRILEGLEQGLALFYQHQGETLHVHEQYLNNNLEYSQTFYELMRQQYSLLANGASTGIPESVERGMAMFHNHQGETLRTHEQYMKNQAEASKFALGVLQQQSSLITGITSSLSSNDAVLTAMPAPRAIETSQEPRKVVALAISSPTTGSDIPSASAQPATVIAPAGHTLDELMQSMLEVVSEKTGYPVEMLDLDMEIEADLGIDSIKRVEILGTMMDLYPDLPEVNPEELAELRTLRQIVEHLQSQLPGADISMSMPAAAAISPDAEALFHHIANVVSENTGYPAEMLEMDMEMENELGIDRVKLVEILGGIREQYSIAGEIDHDELAALRTLEDLIMYTKKRVAVEESPIQQPLVEESVPQGFARLKPLPLPDFWEFTLPDNHVCLITDDGTTTSVRLAETLAKKNWNVVMLSFPTSTISERQPLSQDIPRVELKNLSETHLEKTLQAVSKDHGEIGGFIHVSPPHIPTTDEGILVSEDGKDLLRHTFLIAKHLKIPLMRTTPSGRRRFFLTIARLNGRLGIGEGNFRMVDGGLFGLVKTLNQEAESVFCRAIDLSPDLNADQSLLAILAELHDPDTRIVETGRGPHGRVTLVAEELQNVPSAKTRNLIDASSVFLVSGGAKGVTAECVMKLASACQGKYILLGRSVYTGKDPSWARGCFDETELKKRGMEEFKAQGEKPTPAKVEGLLKPILADREITRTLMSIRERGGEAEYVSVDVTDPKALQRIIPVVERFGTITGIIHGAGVLADNMIEKKTVDEFEAVYSTKVNGLDALLSYVDISKLKHLILFSSAAGFFGNPGQSDYSLSNEIINKTAQQFKHRYPDCQVISFNWGPWDGGMVTDSLKKMFAERNIQVIPIDGGTKVFVDAITADRENIPQILVGSSMVVAGRHLDSELQTYRVTRQLKLEDNPFLQDHALGDQAVLPMICATAWMADTCEEFCPGYRFFRCQDHRTLKGIVFDETLAAQHVIDLQELRKTDSGEVELDVKISGQQSGKKLLSYYSSQILLLPNVPEAPIYENFDVSENQVIEGNSLYHDGTLFHGPIFQTIDRVLNHSREKLTMLCHVPEINESEQGQFPIRDFNPYALDVLYQGMLVWVRQYHNAGSLPSKGQAIEHYCPLTTGQKFYVSLEIKKSTKTSMVGDVIAHDEMGRIYTRIIGAEVTISKNLDQRFPNAKQS